MAQAGFPAPEEEATTGPLLPRRSMEEDTDMDITPMIDITFLLLIFFLVASAMDPQAAIQLPKAEYGDGVDPDTAAIITLGYRPGEPAAVYLGNGKVESTLAQGPWPDLRRRVLEYLENQLVQEKKTTVLIKAEGEVSEGEVNRIEQLVGEAGYSSLHIAVMDED